MRGKTKASPHKTEDDDPRMKPIISVDYAFLGTKASDGEEMGDEEANRAGHPPRLVMWDGEGRGLYVYATEKKGPDDALVKRAVETSTPLDTRAPPSRVIKSQPLST